MTVDEVDSLSFSAAELDALAIRKNYENNVAADNLQRERRQKVPPTHSPF